MAKKKPSKHKPIKEGEKGQAALLEECQTHESDSHKWLSTKRDTWDEKESMLICRLEDQLSTRAKSQVFDPVLSTLCMDRAARVMARPASGRAYAVSRDDLGKNALMNLLLKYYRKNANEHYSHLMKLRLTNFYSSVYGSFFGLVPWRVNPRNGYIGPEYLNLEMRNVRPQPGKKNVDESDWFGVKASVSASWLLEQQKANPDIWQNVDNMMSEMKARKSEGDNSKASVKEARSYVERELYPSLFGDTVFPSVDIYTEYRTDKWITWTPQQIDNKKSRPWILRIVENPYPEGMLPITVKHAFPLLDSIIGLGEFERGQTLQFAVNSLINLYLDGVKYSIFPPLHINPDNVTPSSIKWGAGEKWFMNNPNKDVQPMNLNPQGMQTFQSTYGFMQTAIHNLMGTAQVTKTEGVEAGMGKSPEAIKYMSFRESARDNWDRFMMEDTVGQIYTRWIALAANELEVDQIVRVHEAEIKELKNIYPKENILEVFKSGKRGNVKINKKYFQENGEPVKFDFEIEPGSTMKRNVQDEAQFLGGFMALLLKNPGLLAEIREKGKDIDFAELVKRTLLASPVRDWDRILIEPEQKLGEEGKEGKVEGKVVPTISETPAPVKVPEFKDQAIAAAAHKIFGGIKGIPTTPAI